MARSIARAVRRQRDGHHLAALAGDGESPVASLEAQLLDVGGGSFRYPQPVQREQRDQRMHRWRAEPGGDEERAELVAVQRGRVGLVVDPRAADVGGRRAVQELFFDGVLVKSGDGGQPPRDGGAGPAHRLQLSGEGLNVGAADGEQPQRAGAAPAGELAQVQGVCLAGQAAVPGQEPGESNSLGVSEGGLDRCERGGWGGCGHRAPPGWAGTGRLGQPGPQR
jgi:hypothetical protein